MKFTVAKKLGLAFGSILGLMLVCALASQFKVQLIRKNQDQVMKVRVPTVVAVRSLQRDLNLLGSKARQAILAGSDAGRKASALKVFDSAWESAQAQMDVLTELSPRWTLQENRDRLNRIREELPKLRQVSEEAIALAGSGERDAVIRGGNDVTDKAAQAFGDVNKNLGEMIDSMDQLLKQEETEMTSASSSLIWTMWGTVLAAIVIGALVAIGLSRGISRAVSAVLANARGIAKGDLTQAPAEVTSSDELGELAAEINTMQDNLRSMIVEVAENAQQVASASEEFTAVNQQITSNSEETTAQANVVSSATEQVNRNLQTVATGAEEMSSTIADIAKNASESARVAGEAVKTAAATNATVSKLGTSSAEIGQVIKVITSIAQQTNLLALNATIEAARAGEAGKGFAVVANEVKELAKQTAKATEDISQKIGAIQEDTKEAVGAIGTISTIINQINDISSTIATAVEEQSATTNEMTRNVAEAAKGSTDITQNIGGVAQAAQGTSSSAHESMKAAQQLAELSTKLRGLVERFRVTDQRAANGRRSLAA